MRHSISVGSGSLNKGKEFVKQCWALINKLPRTLFLLLLCSLLLLFNDPQQVFSQPSTTQNSGASLLAIATDYYVSPSGSDENSGTSPSSPWRSLDKVNSVTFEPGDVIHFERGGEWRGKFKPQGSGTEDHWIRFTTYGSGDKPKILGSERVTDWEHHSGSVYKKTNMDWATGANPWTSDPAGVFQYDNPNEHPIRLVQSSTIPSSNGQWYYDTNENNGTLYITTTDGASPDTHRVEVCKIDVIMTLSNLSYVEFNNFSIQFGGFDNARIFDSDHIRFSDFYFSSNGYPLHVNFFILGGEYIEVSDSIMFDTAGGVLFYPSETRPGHHNTVRRCTVTVSRSLNQNRDCLVVHADDHGRQAGDYHLFEDNVVSGCGEGGFDITSGDYHILRNNIGFNHGEECIQLGHDSDHVLIENNICFENDRQGIIVLGNIAEGARGKNVVRNNVVFDSKKAGIITKLDNAIYNNVFSNSETRRDISMGYEDTADGTSFKNNIVYNDLGSTGRLQFTIGLPSGIEMDFNNYYTTSSDLRMFYIQDTGEVLTLEQMRDLYWSGVHSFIGDPMFIDLSGNDFHLQADSPLIDAGTFLTTTTSSGSGTVMTVEDASYFIDGYGIVEGDLIQLEGQTQIARITNVDYDNNILTLDTSLTWAAGQGVSLPYSGNAPDIGAYEFSGFPTPTFVDVPLDHWAHDYIETLYQDGYTAGCSLDPLMYCPEATMTRAESAVFVERGIHSADYFPDLPTEKIFADVPLEEWYAKWATALWEDGFTAGCGTDPLIYCPLQGHTRAEGGVFFLRMMYGTDYVPPEPVGIFVDVPITAWYADWAEAAYEAGIIPACQTEPEFLFCPGDPLDRAMAAYMMVQAKGLQVP
jgi:hypothetical protein